MSEITMIKAKEYSNNWHVKGDKYFKFYKWWSKQIHYTIEVTNSFTTYNVRMNAITRGRSKNSVVIIKAKP